MRAWSVPLGIAFVSGTATGLLAGLSWSDALAAAVALASCLAVVRRPVTRRLLIVGLAGALGLAHGARARDAVFGAPLARWFDDRVLAGLGEDPVRLRGRVIDDARPGEFGVRLRLRVSGWWTGDAWEATSGVVQVSVAGAAAAGVADAWTAGRPMNAPVLLRRPGVAVNFGGPSVAWQTLQRDFDLVGTIKSAALVEVAPGRPWAEAAAVVRRAVRRRSREVVGRWAPASAAMVTAILIGDRAALDETVLDRMRAAGTYHVVAISGGNVAIVVVLCVVLARLVVRGARPAALLALAAVVAYGLIVGREPSVTRAVTAATIYLVLGLAGLRPGALPVLALVAGGIAILDPLQVIDVGAWLSFGATAGLVLAAPRWMAWARGRAGPGPVARAGLVLAAMVAATLAAELAVLPVQALVFGRVGLVGLVANLIAVPAMTVVQAAGAVAVVAAPWAPGLAWIAAGGAHAGTTLLVESARIADAAPWFVWRTPPASPAWAAVYYGGGIGWLLADRPGLRRAAAGGAVIGAIALCTAPALGRAVPPADRLRLTAIDVGQGDALLLQWPTGRSMLVDAGGGDAGIGARVVVPAVQAAGVRRLDWLVITHADRDHIGGAREVVRVLRPREIWDGVPVEPDASRAALVAEAAGLGIPWRQVTRGDVLRLAGVRLEVRHPPVPDWERPRVRNDDSVVLRVTYGDVSLLLTGDAGAEFEAAGLPDEDHARLRVLKVGHHGSRTSTSEAFVARVRPDLALVSVGRGNLFGHPVPDVLGRLDRARAIVLRTDRDGAVALETDGRVIDVRTAMGRRFRVLAWPDP